MNNFKYELKELTEDETVQLYALAQTSPKKAKKLYKELVKAGGWALIAMKKHAEARGIKIDMPTSIFVLYLCDGAIGKCVKYLDAFMSWSKENDQTSITLKETFCMEIFPIGVLDFNKPKK